PPRHGHDGLVGAGREARGALAEVARRLGRARIAFPGCRGEQFCHRRRIAGARWPDLELSHGHMLASRPPAEWILVWRPAAIFTVSAGSVIDPSMTPCPASGHRAAIGDPDAVRCGPAVAAGCQREEELRPSPRAGPAAGYRAVPPHQH